MHSHPAQVPAVIDKGLQRRPCFFLYPADNYVLIYVLKLLKESSLKNCNIFQSSGQLCIYILTNLFKSLPDSKREIYSICSGFLPILYVSILDLINTPVYTMDVINTYSYTDVRDEPIHKHIARNQSVFIYVFYNQYFPIHGPRNQNDLVHRLRNQTIRVHAT